VPKTGETSGVERSSSAYTYYCAEEPTSIEPEVSTALIVEPEVVLYFSYGTNSLAACEAEKAKVFFYRT
jgi:hypothetical protein